MTFIRAKTFDSLFKGKIYTHHSGDNVYPEGHLVDYLSTSIKNAPQETKQGDYFISLLWSDEKRNELMDIFVYSDIKNNWKGNPGISSWVVTNGIWKNKNPITCGEGIILLGREEEYRRTTRNISQYLKHTLDLNILNNILKG